MRSSATIVSIVSSKYDIVAVALNPNLVAANRRG